MINILSAAIRNEDLKQFKELLIGLDDINQYTSEGNPLIFDAIGHGEEFLKICLDSGADPNLKNSSGISPIFNSINYDEKYLKILINSGAELNVCNDEGFTPLMIAAYYGLENHFKIMIEHGADPNFKNNDGIDVVTIALNKGKIEILMILKEYIDLEDWVGIDNKDIWAYAANSDYPILCFYFLSKYVFGVPIVTDNHLPPIVYALMLNNKYPSIELLKVLIDNHKCYPDMCFPDGQNILHVASMLSCAETIDFLYRLYSNYIDINSQDDNGYTPLIHAVRRDEIDINVINKIIELGGDINKSDKNNYDPLDHAIVTGKYESAVALIDSGALLTPKKN